MLLYSWRFSRNSAPIHWLVHGHMTSKNETVSRQMPRAGNIAKTMTSNGKQFTVTWSTVHCWPLLPVMAGISAQFSNFAFVLFCYITNHFMTGPLGNSEFCFPRISMFPSTSSRLFVSAKQELHVHVVIVHKEQALHIHVANVRQLTTWTIRSRQLAPNPQTW